MNNHLESTTDVISEFEIEIRNDNGFKQYLESGQIQDKEYKPVQKIFVSSSVYEIHPQINPDSYSTGEDIALEHDIFFNGQKVPIVLVGLNDKYCIVDGIRRYRILKKLGIDCNYIIQDISDDDILNFRHTMNIARHHYSSSQLACFACEEKPEQIALNKDKLKAKMSAIKRGTQIEVEEILDTNQYLSKKWGVSHTYIIKAEKVMKADEKIFSLLKTGEINFSEADVLLSLKINQPDVYQLYEDDKIETDELIRTNINSNSNQRVNNTRNTSLTNTDNETDSDSQSDNITDIQTEPSKDIAVANQFKIFEGLISDFEVHYRKLELAELNFLKFINSYDSEKLTVVNHFLKVLKNEVVEKRSGMKFSDAYIYHELVRRMEKAFIDFLDDEEYSDFEYYIENNEAVIKRDGTSTDYKKLLSDLKNQMYGHSRPLTEKLLEEFFVERLNNFTNGVPFLTDLQYFISDNDDFSSLSKNDSAYYAEIQELLKIYGGEDE